jgi:hypothetical protein
MKQISAQNEDNIISLFKDGNIHLNIQGNIRKAYKIVFFEEEDSLGKRTCKCIYDPNTIYTGWNCRESLDFNSDTYPNKIQVTVSSEMGWFTDFLYDKQKDEFYKLHQKRNPSLLKNIKPPVMITGSPGGGTSYITRILKHRGLYCGIDSGNKDMRKNHESIIFTSIKDCICFHNKQFYGWFDKNDLEIISRIVKDQVDHYYPFFKNQLEYKIERFWNYSPLDILWGWKDPTISIVLPIWKKIFPSGKVLIIQRDKQKLSNATHDVEGNWFRDNYDNVLKYYYNPDLTDIPPENVFYCNFSDVVNDMNKMNEMLQWIGLDILKDKQEFKQLLTTTGYEGKINEF